MSRSKGRILRNQSEKIVIIAAHFDWTKNIHWESGLGIKSSTLSNWRKGSAMSFESLERIAKKIDVSASDLAELSSDELAKKLGVDVEILRETGLEPKLFSHVRLAPNDLSLLAAAKGDHYGFFLAREGRTMEQDFIGVEKFRIGRESYSSNSMSFEQYQNQIVGSPASGAITVINERAVAYLTYDEYYPPSLYNLIPFAMSDGSIVLFGIYSDVTAIPDKEVFSVKCVIFPDSSSFDGIGSKIYKGDVRFDAIHPLLDEEIETGRKRFVVEGTRETSNQIQECWYTLKGGS